MTQVAHLSARDICKRYGPMTVLHNVAFDIPCGDMVALIGPNGAGKSTLFGVLGGSLMPEHGSVLLDGQVIIGRGPEAVARAGVGRTFQTSAPYRSLGVLENLLLVDSVQQPWWRRMLLPLWHKDASHARAVLDEVGLGHLAAEPCSTLSYGDAKRLELALALMRDPKLLLMDEPTAGMAPSERAAFMTLVHGRSQARGMTVLFTEHDMATVFGFASRILVLDRGQIIADDSPDAIRRNAAVQKIYLGHGDLTESRMTEAL